MFPLAHPSPQSKRHLDRFSHFGPVYRTVVRPVCLSVCITLVYCVQTVEWIKMKLGMVVGHGPGHIVLDGDAALPPQKGHSPQFSAHVYCGQTVAHLSCC